jgi:hypothetical protein
MANRVRRVLGFSAAILLATITVSEAKDLCINPNIRLSRFKRPAQGQCLPVAGTDFNIIQSSGAAGHYGRVTGTVCTRSDGTQLYIALTAIFDPTTAPNQLFFRLIGINIDLSTGTYFAQERDLDNGTLATTGQAGYCSGISIP